MKLLLTLAITSLGLLAADATGNWTGTLVPAEGEGNGGPARLVLKQEGTSLTGTAGPDAGEQHPISKGKVDNGVLTFEVAREDGLVMRFSLKQDGDEIKGDISRERNGRTQTAKLNLKREK